jgi:exopolysaccharide biosynthesis polyprenyl glycosylphosphotransferase
MLLILAAPNRSVLSGGRCVSPWRQWTEMAETFLFPNATSAADLSKPRFDDRVKRTSDLVIAFALILLTLPVMIIAALAIKYDSAGPVLYRQQRVGHRGQRFMLLKFRSMVEDAERDGRPVWAAHGDPRVTRVGRFIRLVRIDELPQLLNVLWGDMSMVGPRPERPYFVDQLSKSIPRFVERHMVKPGITGWAQVNYPYGASIEDARNKLVYDLDYIEKRCVRLDFRILFSTIRVVLLQQGAR